jgi:hypothetical protein
MLHSLSSVIAKSGHTFFLPSPVARSVSVTGSGSITHAGVSNPGYVVYNIIYACGINRAIRGAESGRILKGRF